MRNKGISIVIAGFLVLSLFAWEAQGQRENPGSCLLFPYYDNSPGNMTIITITNVGFDNIVVRLVWIDEDTCAPLDTWIELTQNDTFTFLNDAMNPFSERGFFYAYAVESYYSRGEVDYDYLVGREHVIGYWEDGTLKSFGINAAAFQADDVTGDGKLELNGIEFSAAPKLMFFPRFFGQPDTGSSGLFSSKLILINLTGGQYFNAVSEVLIYNDNEKPFSATAEFSCFTMIPLNELSGAVQNSFLVSTDHDPIEPVGFAGLVETGWFSVKGTEATNIYFTHFSQQIGIYGVLVEKLGFLGMTADLPLQVEGDSGDYDRVMLWSTRPDGY
jgi:hypothetical protein